MTEADEEKPKPFNETEWLRIHKHGALPGDAERLVATVEYMNAALLERQKQLQHYQMAIVLLARQFGGKGVEFPQQALASVNPATQIRTELDPKTGALLLQVHEPKARPSILGPTGHPLNGSH